VDRRVSRVRQPVSLILFPALSLFFFFFFLNLIVYLVRARFGVRGPSKWTNSARGPAESNRLRPLIGPLFGKQACP